MADRPAKSDPQAFGSQPQEAEQHGARFVPVDAVEAFDLDWATTALGGALTGALAGAVGAYLVDRSGTSESMGSTPH